VYGGHVKIDHCRSQIVEFEEFGGDVLVVQVIEFSTDLRRYGTGGLLEIVVTGQFVLIQNFIYRPAAVAAKGFVVKNNGLCITIGTAMVTLLNGHKLLKNRVNFS